MAVKGVAGGSTSSWMRRKLGPDGTIYYYEWNDIDQGYEKWPMMKGHPPTCSWDADGEWHWISEASVKASAAASTGPRQWFILGNELEMSWGGCQPMCQASLFKQAYGWIKGANSNVKVIVGGWNTADVAPDGNTGQWHLGQVAATYRSMYGVDVECQGVHFHAYYTQAKPEHYESHILEVLDLIKYEYPNARYNMLSEWGHTQDYSRMMDAMRVVQSLKDRFHAVFWYKSCYDPACEGDPDWPCDRKACLFKYCSNVRGDHGLTNVGLQYRALRLS